MEKTRKSHKKQRKYIGIILVVVLLISSAFVLLKGWEKRHSQFPETNFDESVVEYNGKNYVLKENIETFLVLGLDKFDGVVEADAYNNDMQSDFLILFVFDKNEQTYSAIHINRDTMVDVNILGVAGNKVDTKEMQIALAHTYGNGKDVSCRNVADSVSKLLYGTKIGHYASFTMDSVAVVNDLVGGVEVEVLDDFTGIDNTLIKGETVKLQGEQALKYVRTRYGLEDSTNSTRMYRQQQYIKALCDAFDKRADNDEEFVMDAVLKMSDYMVSDRSVTQLQTLAEKFSQYEFLGIKDFEGESILGEKFIEFYPNEELVMATVIDLFYEVK